MNIQLGGDRNVFQIKDAQPQNLFFRTQPDQVGNEPRIVFTVLPAVIIDFGVVTYIVLQIFVRGPNDFYFPFMFLEQFAFEAGNIPYFF